MRVRRPTLVAAAIVAALLAVGGCGRKGGLEPPGAVAVAPIAPTVFGTSPTVPPPPPVPTRTGDDEAFILDPLI